MLLKWLAVYSWPFLIYTIDESLKTILDHLKTTSKTIEQVNWWQVLSFYSAVLITTFSARQLPNVVQLISRNFTDVLPPWNLNHGIAILVVSLIFYKYWEPKFSKISLLGDQKAKVILCPFLLFIGYGILGFKNGYGINEHVWALIFCSITLIYDLMEEFTWRVYLIDTLTPINLVLKSLISGIMWAVWHLLIFDQFDQFGGFWGFMGLSIVFSLLLTFSAVKTKSVLVPATLHALLIRNNIVTLICLVVYWALLFTWNKWPRSKRNKIVLD